MTSQVVADVIVGIHFAAGEAEAHEQHEAHEGDIEVPFFHSRMLLSGFDVAKVLPFR
jgi:hypothetical protein